MRLEDMYVLEGVFAEHLSEIAAGRLIWNRRSSESAQLI